MDTFSGNGLVYLVPVVLSENKFKKVDIWPVVLGHPCRWYVVDDEIDLEIFLTKSMGSSRRPPCPFSDVSFAYGTTGRHTASPTGVEVAVGAVSGVWWQRSEACTVI